MEPNIQPILESDQVILYPLKADDFEELYQAASDPLVWEQHPNKDRWKKEVFQSFFEGALQSKGAFKIVDKETGEVIGSTRYYNYDDKDSSILIGYTFYARKYWGKGVNQAVKQMMLDYIFAFVSKVYFHIGADNVRSQIAISRTGAVKVGEQEVAYYGEAPKLNYVYMLERN